jgi:serine/threonine-protein kinase
MSHSLLGEEFNGYKVGEQIHAGSFGDIYQAYSLKDGGRAVIKLIRAGLLDDKSLQERFFREIRLLQNLDHPAIVPVWAFGFKDYYYYFIMPYIEGGDLFQLLQNKRFNPSDVMDFLAQIAPALHHGHQQNVLHRDLKPENILVQKLGPGQYRYYLSDFGLAKRPGQDKTVTQPGKIVGTPEYLSPEYILDEDRMDARSDVYSLAVMVYELLLGVVPFTGANEYEVLLAHTKYPPPAPSKLQPNFPPALEALLLKNFEKDPARRDNTALGFMDNYQRALEDLPEAHRQHCFWVVEL